MTLNAHSFCFLVVFLRGTVDEHIAKKVVTIHFIISRKVPQIVRLNFEDKREYRQYFAHNDIVIKLRKTAYLAQEWVNCGRIPLLGFAFAIRGSSEIPLLNTIRNVVNFPVTDLLITTKTASLCDFGSVCLLVFITDPVKQVLSNRVLSKHILVIEAMIFNINKPCV